MTLSQRLQTYTLVVLLASLAVSKALAEITSTLLILGWLWAGRNPWPSRAWWSRWRAEPLTPSLTAWLAVSALSIGVSSFPGVSVHGFIGKTLEYACLCWSVASLATVHSHWRLWWRGLVVGSCCLIADVLWQRCTGADILGHRWSYYGRITGPFTNPHDLATYLIVTMPVVIGGALSLPPAARWWRLGGTALTVVMALLLVATTSRSGWLGLVWAVVVLICGWVAAPRWLQWLLVCSGVALLGVAVWGIAHSSGRAHALALLGPGLHDRWLMWQAAWRMWRERWWLGHGVNTFMSEYLTYWVGGERTPRYAHNCYLQMGAETGLLGLAAFLWVLTTVVREGLRGIRRWRGHPTRHLVVGVLAAVAAFLAQSVFDTNFYSLRSATYFWAMAGVLVGLAAAARISWDTTTAPPR